MTYNQEATIGRALDSVLRQQCTFPYEIIIGEDASTDGTRAVCEDYASRYPDIIRMMPATANKGVVDNYFDCLLECRGEYVTDCAGDDEWGDIDRMQRQVDYLETHPEDVAVMSDWITENNGIFKYTAEMEEYDAIHRNVSGHEMLRIIFTLKGGLLFLSAMTFRRKPLMDVYKINPRSLRRPDWGCEDTPLLCALASKGSFGYLPLMASIYHYVDGSISRKKNLHGQFEFALNMVSSDKELCYIYGIDLQEISSKYIPILKYAIGLAFQIREKEVTVRLFKCLEGVNLRLPFVSRIKLLLLKLYK